MTRPTWLTLNLENLNHNLVQVRQFAPKSSVLAMVKSNAYGHGFKTIVTALKDADAFGVACLDEALHLRESGIKKNIVLMEGFFNEKELTRIAENDLDIIVHHAFQLELLEKKPLTKPVNVWLKIDTGMHRLGFRPQEIKKIWQRLSNMRSVKKNPVLLSHFSCSDELDNPATSDQLNRFIDCTSDISSEKSLANSAAIIANPATHLDWVRPGIMLYGVSPFANKTGNDHNLKPVMTLHSELIAIQELHKGDAVGYGRTFICPQNMRIGVIGIGYGDGYPWHAKNGTPVLVNQRIVPLAGRVSMDMITVDLSTQPQAKIGDPVVLWGEGLPVETVARDSSTIAYELLCKVTDRVLRS